MITRFSKCDFWIPDEILDFSRFFSKKVFYFSNFYKIFFDFEKNIFGFEKNILKSEICPGIQKSHLENRTII